MARRGAAPSAVGAAARSGPLAALGFAAAGTSRSFRACTRCASRCSAGARASTAARRSGSSPPVVSRRSHWRTPAAAIRARHSRPRLAAATYARGLHTHATSATGLGALLPCHICTGIGLTPVRARPSHICTGIGLTPVRARPSHICTGIGLTPVRARPSHICTGIGGPPHSHAPLCSHPCAGAAACCSQGMMCSSAARRASCRRVRTPTEYPVSTALP